MTAALVPALRVENGAIFANSKDIAQVFGKRHDHVVRDIRALRSGIIGGIPNFGDTLSWFQMYTERNPQNGQVYDTFNMTRDGFALLVMGYTGEKALRFKVAYIQEFNRMEANLKIWYSILKYNSYSTGCGNIEFSTTGYGINRMASILHFCLDFAMSHLAVFALYFSDSIGFCINSLPVSGAHNVYWSRFGLPSASPHRHSLRHPRGSRAGFRVH